MKITRRDLGKYAAGAAAVATLEPLRAAQREQQLASKIDKVLASAVLQLDALKQPVRIATIDLLSNADNFMVRVRTADGATGISVAHPDAIKTTYPILLKRVVPSFIGKDARDLERLLWEVYLERDNYKWQGLPFWTCVAAVEIAVLDLLGKSASLPIGALLGGVVRREIGVYRASGNRGNTPEQEIQYLKKIVAETGATAIKFRLGGRMMYNDETTRRDKALIPLTRKTFGDAMTIYADANGSYDIPAAIRIGHLMEEYKLAFFEEPLPFDDYDGTKKVADALKIPIALGEQENSLNNFRRIIQSGVMRIAQPDILYFGGFIRSIRVARIAAAAAIQCTPHMSGGGLGYLYVAHFASCVPNAGPHQEFKGFGGTLPITSDTSSLKSEKGVIHVPSGPGLGITIDPDFLQKSKVISGAIL
ncbi:MAG TPA: mandelate racemase/muconate lactonizing enzyme family protein [Acidobacteriota bacterium]|jgi:L-alanine-DL-glutamate epimerase-like enolase superfamily enzyme